MRPNRDMILIKVPILVTLRRGLVRRDTGGF